MAEYSGAVLGVLSAVLYGRRGHVWKKNQLKRRLHAITIASATCFLFPVAMWDMIIGSTSGSSVELPFSAWPFLSTIIFGVILIFYVDSIAEESFLCSQSVCAFRGFALNVLNLHNTKIVQLPDFPSGLRHLNYVQSFAMIENEFGPVEWEIGAPGKAYTKWAAKMVVGLNTGVPWIMCKQEDAPDPIAHVFKSESGPCAAFLSNYDPESSAKVNFENVQYDLPPWSVSILPDCKNVVFNTARVGLKGEALSLHTVSGSSSVEWVEGSLLAQKQPLTWYKTTFNAPEGNDPLALDMNSMGKGLIWINGENIRRHWPGYTAHGSCSSCSYAGIYNEKKCRSNCGEASQRWYHVPQSWLNPTGNLLVVFEEWGGDPTGIALLCRRNRGHQRPKQVPTVLCQPSSSSSFLLDSGSMHYSNTAIAVAIVAVTIPSPLQKPEPVTVMAAPEQEQEQEQEQQPPTTKSSLPPSNVHYEKLLSSYLGLGFTLFLGLIPKSSTSLVSTLQSRNRDLSLKLIQAEDQLRQLHSRRREDSKANARVVEIFASHRHAWQQEEKRLLQQIDASADEIAHLRAKVEELEKLEIESKANVEELKREVAERDEILNFMARKSEFDDSSETGGGCGGHCYSEVEAKSGKCRVSEGFDPVAEECFVRRGGHNVDEISGMYGQANGFNPEFLNSTSKFWTERATLWQDVQYESLESLYHLKHFVARRESPWKVDGEATGISSKLKLLEQELLNLERIGKCDLSKVPSLMRKQAKRYQAFSGKIDDLCRRMQASDPCEPSLSSEFRTQRQTEFLLEAFRLQQRASETGQKLMALQNESRKGFIGDELEASVKLATRRSLDSIRNNFKEIQRNLEIWLARIIGDLEGILARDGASRVREYYISRYPFVQ
ncbi:hypothetical protein F0562_011754 [Nyssa sinensis]|uniref:Uncharacterized protein n=1 Tax=Nyssa sinensis TaxID=561372 RepID=A0A5J4ZQC3_9ASTE|nr:hypothetical protein F0562_011754 [Nyssa sinensis]